MSPVESDLCEGPDDIWMGNDACAVFAQILATDGYVCMQVSKMCIGRADCSTLVQSPWAMQAVLKGEMPLLEDMDRLPYCAAVVLETLRMHPPAYMIGRCAVVPTSFTESEYNIPSKTTALIAPYLLHFHPNKWDAPEQFSPSRWAASDWKTALSKFGPNGSYLPFGSGPRVCIGTHFAFFEVMVVIVSLLQNFKTIPASTVSPFPVAEPIITLRPREVQVRLLKRA